MYSSLRYDGMKAAAEADPTVENEKPKRSLVQVFFPDDGRTLSYYNDAFDLRVGDLVLVSGKLEGQRGVVEKIIPPEIQARLDAGNDFGDRAMGMFGPYEEMTVYRPGTTIPDKKRMLERTAEHLEAGTPVICEAALCNYNNYCAVDILRKTETGYDFYEVKNAPAVYDQFVKDAGFQYYIITRCKVKIGKIYIVIHGPDEDNPFVPVDVTKQAKSYYKWINDHIWDLNRMQKEKDEVAAVPGDQCHTPYDCWYYDYCHGRKEGENEHAEFDRDPEIGYR